MGKAGVKSFCKPFPCAEVCTAYASSCEERWLDLATCSVRSPQGSKLSTRIEQNGSEFVLLQKVSETMNNTSFQRLQQQIGDNDPTS